MKFIIKHEITGRMRVHMFQPAMSFQEADKLKYFLEQLKQVDMAKVYERTADAVITYKGSREEVLEALRKFNYEKTELPSSQAGQSSRALNAEYQEKMVDTIFFRYFRKWFFPYPVRVLWIGCKALKYVGKGIRSLLNKKMEVSVLDAASIGVSVLRQDFKMADSIMFLLRIGEILEEWTHKKSVSDLASAMSLNIGKVWLHQNDTEVLTPVSEIKCGDQVVVYTGNVIPFDGKVVRGEAMINQASLTGEAEAVRKAENGYVYAGTVVEEGEITLSVASTEGGSRYEQVVKMIEDSEKLKSGLESKAEHLADKLVPYTLLGTGLTYLLTRNTTKTIAVLMVDFSCALKLSMPIAVLSAIREASMYHMTVKGGKYLEAVAEADTIVFDKTGTLTKAQPEVTEVVSFNGEDPDELLRMAACIEEHFPHSMAKAVVNAAKKRRLEHEEMHSKVEYIVAHGISTRVNNKCTLIGSYHFIFEDEKCSIPEGMEQKFEALPDDCSHLYLAIEKKLAAVICIKDPLREDAAETLKKLRQAGISKMVMMTGDSDRVAKKIAIQVGVDEYYSEVLPEDKAAFVRKEKEAKRKVIMIGDGINDSPALSAADAGIAISDGAQIAREIADITIEGEDLLELVKLKKISNGLMAKIKRNYFEIVSFNTLLILLGVGGIIQPTTSALLHNTSTLLISLNSMKNIL